MNYEHISLFQNKPTKTSKPVISRNSKHAAVSRGMCDQFSKAKLFDEGILLNSDTEDTISVADCEEEEEILPQVNNQEINGIEDQLKNLNVVISNAIRSERSGQRMWVPRSL